MKTKNLKFTFENIEFEAEINFSSDLFSSSNKSFYSAKLIKPIALDCGYYEQIHKGLNMASKEFRDSHFIYEEDKSIKLDSTQINIFPEVIKDIKYCYFNRKNIENTKVKINKFNRAVDKRYFSLFEKYRKKKQFLKEKLKANVLDNKCYQKEIMKLNSTKIELELNINSLKKRYYDRYFECCRLKKNYCKN